MSRPPTYTPNSGTGVQVLRPAYSVFGVMVTALGQTVFRPTFGSNWMSIESANLT
jgi:hypothetical protein